MNSPGKYIAAGVFIGLLMFKPTFGIALGKSIGELSVAAFENNVPQPTPQPIVEQPLANVPDEKEDREAIFVAISKIMDRLDQIELTSKRSEPQPEPELPVQQVSTKEGNATLTMPEIATNSNELLDPKKFDREFDKKFSQR